MNSTSAYARGSLKDVSLRKRFRKVMLSTIALLFTLAPLFSISLWIINVYSPQSQRETLALSSLERPSDAPRLFGEPIVSVTFDDSRASAYQNGAPILEKYQLRTTQYVLSGQFDQSQYLSEDQVRSLSAAGHDIQSHTVDHSNLPQVSDGELKRELTESKETLSKVTNTKVSDFSSPYSSYDQRTMAEIKSRYRSQRNTEASALRANKQDYNLKQNFDVYQIKGFSVRKDTTTAQIVNYLAEARQMNAWVVLVYHEIDAASDSEYSVSPQNFDSQMRAVSESNLKVATMDEVLDYYLAPRPTQSVANRQ